MFSKYKCIGPVLKVEVAALGSPSLIWSLWS